MLFYIEIAGIGIIERLFEKSGNPISDKLYIRANSIEDAIEKTKKYLGENNCSHLSIKNAKKLDGKLL